MKLKTILKFKSTLEDIKKSGMSISEYCENNSMTKQGIYDKYQEFKKNSENDYYDEIIELYNSIVSKSTSSKIVKNSYKEPKDTGNSTEINFERDEQNHIIYYEYKIYRRNKTPLIGKLSRDEASIIYRLYSYYGASLTQREVSRYFSDLSLIDFKRILSAFNIYKSSSPFPPHMIEEHSNDELREMQLREKENDFLKKIEEDRIKNNERLLKKYAAENDELKRKLDNLSNFSFKPINLPELPEIVNYYEVSNTDINIYLADMHIGAKVCSGTLYNENIDYGIEECQRRLHEIVDHICRLSNNIIYNNINICLMGDMMDCCGPTNKTSRLDHELPENMDGYEQVNAYISLIYSFIKEIYKLNMCEHINIYSVRCGNHTGVLEYVATKALFAELNKYENIKTVLFNEFFGSFSVQGHQFVISHGKDDKFMKKGLPLNLDDKTKIKMYEWFEDNGFYGNNIHVVKADLHSNAYNSCMKFDYRNVLSLFGASDYSSFNFSRNSYGVSYDIIKDGNVMRGEIQNI